MDPRLSLVIPVLDERDTLVPIYEEITAALRLIPHEIIFVDDGSKDGSTDILRRLAKQNTNVTAIVLARNYGQTAAMAAGFKEARGEVIVSLDADGQNDPADIPRMLAKIDEGFDVVSGWRQIRQDAFWSRRLPSAIANRLISNVTHVPLHDFGCTLKLYRRPIVENLSLYGEMHRFLPAWCAWRGAQIAEVTVHHRPRIKGKSKYTIGRTFKVLLDLLTTKFISGYLSKPNYLFGGSAFLLYFLAFVSTAIVFYDKLGPDRWAHLRIPLLLLACFLGIVGTLLLMIGLLAELIVRLFYDMSGENPYRVRMHYKQAPNP